VERRVALRRTDEEGALRITLPADGAKPGIAARSVSCRYWTERPCPAR
jgi:hypothetical protein